jgi:hypothetical protein
VSTLHGLMSAALVYLGLMAITVSLRGKLPSAIGRFSAVVAAALAFFAIEHFVGLGSLTLWPVLTAVAAWALWYRRETLSDAAYWRDELPFLLVFAWAALWRGLDPDIEPTGEQIPNLYFISQYLSGARLPPPDQWFGEAQRFDFYYAFQHYSAALLARVLDLSAGQAMNLSFCLLFGFAGSLAWYAAKAWNVPRAARALLLATIFVGGSGLAPLVQLSVSMPTDTSAEKAYAASTAIWASTRWSGVYEERINTPAGEAMFRDERWNTNLENAPDLPLETFLYYTLLGDFHPPLGGFLILLFSLALIAALSRSLEQPTSRRSRVMAVLLAATPVLALITNAWVFPLQLGLVTLWLIVRWMGFRERALIRDAAVGAVASVLCIAPFLASFASSALSPSVETVADIYRTRLSILLAVLWPVGLLMLSLVIGKVRELWAWALVVFVVAAGVASEWVFFDDPLPGRYERFNTVLKVWSWLWVAVLAGLAPIALASHSTWARRLAAATLALLLLPGAWNASRYLWNAEFPHAGRWSGDAWLRQDAAHNQILMHLQHSPRGVVLENPRRDAYSSHAAIALFAEQPSLIGWWGTQNVWRGGSAVIERRTDESRRLFAGTLTDSRVWLAEHRVDYILWTREDATTLGPRFQALDDTLSADYEFRTFEYVGAVPIGLWQRRKLLGAIGP